MKYEDVIVAVNEVLDQYRVRLTVRQIYYRLISPPYQLFPNLPQKYKYFDRILTRARERGDVDWHRIEDRARTTIGGDFGWDGTKEYLDSQIQDLKNSWEYYTRRMWDNQPLYVEVWVEKDALSALFSEVARKYRVLTFPSRGYSSFTKIMEALEDRLIRRFLRSQPVIVLHFTDHDPSGLDMTRDLEKRFLVYMELSFRSLAKQNRMNFQDWFIEKFGNWKSKTGRGRLCEIVRCGLTYEQVQRFNLPPNPTKSADPRQSWYVSKFGDQCWELDALPPQELETLIRDSIIKYIDAKQWEADLTQIEAERKELKEKLSKLKILWE